MDRKTKKAIRLKIVQLLDSPNPDKKEIERLGKLLSQKEDKTTRMITRKKVVDAETYIFLRNQGYSMAEVAAHFKCSLEKLRSEVTMLRNRGVIPKNATPYGNRGRAKISREDYMQLSESGKSDTQISEEMNLCRSTLVKWKREWGIRHNKKITITVDEYLEYKHQGMSDIEIENKLGYSRSALYKFKIKHGLSKYSKWGIYKEVL